MHDFAHDGGQTNQTGAFGKVDSGDGDCKGCVVHSEKESVVVRHDGNDKNIDKNSQQLQMID